MKNKTKIPECRNIPKLQEENRKKIQNRYLTHKYMTVYYVENTDV